MAPLHLDPRAIAWVFGGGVFGALARYGLGLAIPAVGGWPLATVVINVVGAFLLGLLLDSLARRGPDVGWARRFRLLGGTGFLGAFTTYSTFAVDAVHLLSAGRAMEALGYVAATLLLGGAATALGIWVAEVAHRVSAEEHRAPGGRR
ncbi:CrcB family protein [Arthrobacter sp. YJM1]|uniref:Fluoride-specific ion channel FluC n=3 Tax=Arthrobacter TaxID=1663 RepID=A0ABU9KJ98_9MICC|nr:CrcB family protein [Arthrobacter sp. YJM1]